MKIHGQQTYAANREILWSLLRDPIVLEKILPGCESFETIAPDEYLVTLGVRMGRTVERFSGTLRLEQVAPLQVFDFYADGQSPERTVTSRGRLTLEDDGDEATAVGYEAEVDVTSRQATLSSRLFETTARAFARRTLEALAKQTAIRTRVYTTSTSVTELTNPSPPAATGIQRAAIWRLALAVVSIILVLLYFRRGLSRQRTRQVPRPTGDIIEYSHNHQGDRSTESEIAAERPAT